MNKKLIHREAFSQNLWTIQSRWKLYPNRLFYLFVQAVSNSCSSGFIDDTKDIKPRNGPCIFSSLALRVIEVGRHSHNSIGHSLKKQNKDNNFKLQNAMSHSELWLYGFPLH